MLYCCTTIKLHIASNGALWQKIKKNSIKKRDGACLPACCSPPRPAPPGPSQSGTQNSDEKYFFVIERVLSGSAKAAGKKEKVQNEAKSHPAGTPDRLKKALPSIWKDFSFDLTQVCGRLRSSSCMCTSNAKNH